MCTMMWTDCGGAGVKCESGRCAYAGSPGSPGSSPRAGMMLVFLLAVILLAY
eukprot:gene8473-17814_t